LISFIAKNLVERSLRVVVGSEGSSVMVMLYDGRALRYPVLQLGIIKALFECFLSLTNFEISLGRRDGK